VRGIALETVVGVEVALSFALGCDGQRGPG